MSRPDKYITTGDLTMTSEATEVGHSTGDLILGQEESRSVMEGEGGGGWGRIVETTTGRQ